MKVIKGFKQATSTLLKNRGLNLDDISDEMKLNIQKLFGKSLSPMQVVEYILNEVRSHGDDALIELTRKLDGGNLSKIEVDPVDISNAKRNISSELLTALESAADRIQTFHESSRINSWIDFNKGLGTLVTPMKRVGAYIPGGTALYPSTILMTAIPAKVAGVDEVIICTPSKGTDIPHPAVLAAAEIAGVDRVFRIGGAQAIAAMAYGTNSIPPVDMICGPGNLFVTLAKKLVFGEVGIDGLYGPTETVIIADHGANPTLCATDLLAQSEHDILAKSILITTSKTIADNVEREVQSRLQRLDRSEIASSSIENHGCIIIIDNLDEAIDLANKFAPEHLSLMTRDPWALLGKIKNSGAIFLGEFSHEVLGDYVAGPSHVMPTGGTARFSSGLGVHSFIKISPVIALSDSNARELSRVAALIARSEGLTAHAEAAEIREELI